MWKRTTPPILKRCLKHGHPHFDTHKLVRRLIESGFSEEQAEAVTDAIKEAQDSRDICHPARSARVGNAHRREIRERACTHPG
jgi:hypothetical protein